MLWIPTNIVSPSTISLLVQVGIECVQCKPEQSQVLSEQYFFSYSNFLIGTYKLCIVGGYKTVLQQNNPSFHAWL